MCLSTSLLVLAIVSFQTLVIAQSEKPNILLILVDDLKPNLGIYGDSVAVSPNIDQLANEGIRFNLAYCNQAVCASSRYNLMLGSRSTSTGLYNFGKEFRDVYPEAVTLPQHFMNNGYHTESMGKVFHIGHGNTNDEASWSIPHHKEKVIEYLLPESTNRQLTREEAFFENTRMYLEDIPNNKELPRGAAWEMPDVLDEAYADGRVARHAIDRLRKLSTTKQPFFMAVGFARPHLPFCAPKKYWDLYDPNDLPMPEFEQAPEGTPLSVVKRNGEITQFTPVPENTDGIYEDDLKRKLIYGYYASMSYMDAQVGRVMDELKRLQLDKNTIVILWGDHGWHLGDHGSWTKHTNFEQATRIPLIIVAPNVTTPGTSTQQLAETVDVYTTLVALADLPEPTGPQPIDGINLMPVLKNPESQVKDHVYHSYPKRLAGEYRIGCAIRTEKYRMVAWVDPSNPDSEKVYELYDYEKDPQETINLAEKEKEVLEEMKIILANHPHPKSG
ncbi:MAG: sulfatase [Bacteroidota bacterium]